MTVKTADQARARRKRRTHQLLAGCLALVTIIVAAGAVKFALHGQWVAWGEPYGPPGSPRTLARHEVTNEEFDACESCRGRGKRGKHGPALCLGQVDEERKTVTVTKSTDPHSEVCVSWEDAMDIADSLTLGYGHAYRCYRRGTWRRKCDKESNDKGFHLAVGKSVLRSADDAEEHGILESIVRDCQVRIAIPSPARGENSNLRHTRKKFYTARLGPARKRDGQAVQCITSLEAKRYADWMSAHHGMDLCYGEATPERKRGEPRAESAPGSANRTADTSAEKTARKPPGTCRGYRLPTGEEWREARRSGTDGQDREDVIGSVPEAVRALCGGETASVNCTGAESGHELDGIDETEHGIVGLTTGVREMVHTEEGLTTLGWSSVDARQYMMAVTAPKRRDMDRRWQREGTGARKPRAEITVRSSQIGFRLIEPSDPLSVKEWARVLLTGDHGR